MTLITNFARSDLLILTLKILARLLQKTRLSHASENYHSFAPGLYKRQVIAIVFDSMLFHDY